MKKFTVFLFLSVIFLLTTKPALAIYDPLSVPNNKVGIHIFSEKDLDDAARLVNKNGDWGYVTIVITEAERDHDRWQQVFDRMRRLHLIPIVRIATKPQGDVWEKPKESEINNWVSFLNSLNWVIKNRYIIIANEPNHASEWGGELDPAGFATYYKQFAVKLKGESNDFFIMPGALDASATGKPRTGTMDESKFIKLMLGKEPDIFNYIDGWDSHSYPNPDFSGKETDRGFKSIAGFESEIILLRSLGINADMPIFITETGWSSEKLDQNQIADKFTYAYKNVWNNKNVVAVTPFILNYPEPPFAQFSWKDKEGNFNSAYSKISEMQKTQGEPTQIIKGDLITVFAPPVIFTGSDFGGAILAKNTGQSIWRSGNTFLTTENDNFVIKGFSFNDIEPMRLGLVMFNAAAPKDPGILNAGIYLKDAKGGRITDTYNLSLYAVKLGEAKIQPFLDTVKSWINGLTALGKK